MFAEISDEIIKEAILNNANPITPTTPPPVKKEDSKDDFFDRKDINDEPMFIAEENTEKEEEKKEEKPLLDKQDIEEKKEEPPASESKPDTDDKNKDNDKDEEESGTIDTSQIDTQPHDQSDNQAADQSDDQTADQPSTQTDTQDENKTLPPLNEHQLTDTAVPIHKTPPPPITPQTSQPISKIHTPITPVVIAALIVAFIGFGGGFAAFRYLPGLTQKAATTADVATMPTDTNIQPPKSNKALPSEVSLWPVYTNTKYLYSVSYPDTWYSQNANNPETDAVRIMNYNPEEVDEGSKIEIVMQNANGQDLKTWVEANNVTTNTNSTALSTVKVGTKEAYQQKTGYQMKTYLLQAGKVMNVTLTSTATELTNSTALYQKVLDSLKLS